MNKLFFIPFFILAFSAKGQYNDLIRSGRPGQSIGPFVVGENVIQSQNGFDFTQLKSTITIRTFESSNVLRIGVSERFEVNTAWRFSVLDSILIPNSRKSGLSLGAIGCRFNLFEGQDYKPAFGIQMSLKFPRLSKVFYSDRLAMRTLFIMRQKISNRLNLISNLGLDYSGNSVAPRGVFVFNLGYNVIEKVGFFIETFGDFSRDDLNIYFNTGGRYLISDNFQVDLSTGFGQNNQGKSFFISTGLSWRITSIYLKTCQNEIN